MRHNHVYLSELFYWGLLIYLAYRVSTWLSSQSVFLWQHTRLWWAFWQVSIQQTQLRSPFLLSFVSCNLLPAALSSSICNHYTFVCSDENLHLKAFSLSLANTWRTSCLNRFMWPKRQIQSTLSGSLYSHKYFLYCHQNLLCLFYFLLIGSSRLVLWSGTMKTFVPASSVLAAPRWCNRSSRGWADNTVALRMTLKVSNPSVIIKMPFWMVFSTEKKKKHLLLNCFLNRFRSFQHNSVREQWFFWIATWWVNDLNTLSAERLTLQRLTEAAQL